MPFTVLKAMVYKSSSIYRNEYISAITDILLPCILLIFITYIFSFKNEPSPNDKYQNYQENSRQNERMNLYLKQWKNFTNSEVKKMSVNGQERPLSKPEFQDEKNLVKKKYADGEFEDNKGIERNDQGEPKIQVNPCTAQYGLALTISFLGTWSGAATLAHVERMSGTVERMRMLAVSDFYIICSYVMHAAFMQLIAASIFTMLLRMHISGPVIQKIDFLPLFLALFLINLHSAVYLLGVSSFFDSNILRGIVGPVSFCYIFIWAIKLNLSSTAQVFGSVLAPVFLVTMVSTVCGLEKNGGVTVESLISVTDSNDIPLLVLPLLLIFGLTIILLVFYYMLNVNPGPYGSARPFYFVLPKHIQAYIRAKYYKVDRNKSDLKFRKSLYEKTQPNIEVGIKIENLYKKYGNLTILKNLSLNIYSGQITALLGHNGAGKTTTLSILSGMISPTSGSAFYQGFDILQNMKKFRQDIGFCPQNDLLHPNLNALNHLIFFGMLGGLSKNKAEEISNDLLKVIGIFERKCVKITKLSGGMRRKLCLALAFVGKPKVIFLDEPSSGVDPESRREIWNIILESRENRILLLTTHFMEEADVLGDQIAMMNHGEIICYGSNMFLKKHYGAGYNISVSCDQDKCQGIIETVIANIPEATIIGENQEWVKFKLPFEKTEHFPKLFKELESNYKTSTIAISCTTMEDVYLKVEAEEGVETSIAPESNLQQANNTHQKVILMGYINRFLELVKKNMICSLRRWFKTFIVVVIAPPLATFVAMDMFNYNSNRGRTEEDFNLFEKQQSTDFTNSVSSCQSDPSSLILRSHLFSGMFTYAIFIVSSTFAVFVHQERISTVKHLILMTGLSPITYWTSILLWDAILYLIFVLISWITFLILDSTEVFDRCSGIYVLLLLIFLTGISMISSMYLWTFWFKTLERFVTVYLTVAFPCGFISYLVINLANAHPYTEILKLQPVTSSMQALLDFSTLALTKQYCKSCGSEECADIIKSGYLKDDLRNDLLYLVGDLILYISLVNLTDYGFFPFLWNIFKSLFIGKIPNNDELNTVDSDVAKEKSRVDGLRTSGSQNEIIVIVDGLAKKYSRSIVAVVDVTFAVSKGECFGLLGVNGAGKTTTFNMLTGLLYPTKGNAFMKGHSLSKEKRKCLTMIGYCPQHEALIEYLTTRQMLTFFARLRLVPSELVDKEVKKWITLFGLDEYSDVPSKNYSGGNKRKLNAAMAFIGDPSIILLDEPTTGVDPFIRRNLWRVIEACGIHDQAIVISSHSMDECEAICNRLTIMARGKMECIGNIENLKTLHGSGYVIKITLSSHTASELETLKSIIESVFSPHIELKDEHEVLLHYHITTNIYKISSLFETMEQIKSQSNILGDYIITNSSLEEVFLGFAKKQK